MYMVLAIIRLRPIRCGTMYIIRIMINLRYLDVFYMHNSFF